MKKKYKSPKTYRCDPDKCTYCTKEYCYRNYLVRNDHTEYCMRTFDKSCRMSLIKRIKERIFGWK